MKKLFALLGLLAILPSCATVGTRMNSINIGMTKSEAIRILGQPTTTGGAGSVEVLHYKGNGFYFIRLVDGKVESFGPEAHAHQVTASNPPLTK